MRGRVYPDSLWLKLVGLALLGYVFYAVATHESNSMHWFSDMVSGTLMGVAIGNAVGVGFAHRVGAGNSKGPDFAVAPMLSGQARGTSLFLRF